MRIFIKYFGKEIDITEWQYNHPGGSKVLRIFDQRDATDVILSQHSEEALAKMNKMAKLPCDYHHNSKVSKNKFSKTYRRLLKFAKCRGYFTPVIFDEVVKILIAFIPTIAGYLLILQTHRLILGACLLAFGWFQLGWLGHDYSHHQYLTQSTTKAATMCNYVSVVAGGIRGTTNAWWKLRHNTHHIVTNQIGKDPDIRVQPLLHFYQNFDPTAITSIQHWYYLPLLSLLHLYWIYESVVVAWKRSTDRNVHFRKLAINDCVCLGMFFIAIFYLVNPTSSEWTSRFLALNLALAISGFSTAIVVFASHYGEEYIEGNKEISLMEQTSKTTRNISGCFGFDDAFIFHLSGALSHQIEHHLFPMMPRSHLRKMTPYVKAAFVKYGFEYRESNIFTCTWLSIQKLFNNVMRNLNMKTI